MVIRTIWFTRRPSNAGVTCPLDMDSLKNILSIFLLCIVCITLAWAKPDSAGHPPEGFAYGGIPYGSMSGNVAEYYRSKSAQIAPVHYVARPIVQYPQLYNLYH
ncbi:uncharacterized protein LOC143915976 [Arctopsyche grandis]|uniref:uncharacterized protein LOC143915976 n=1 Tax=Arctopsyche grandis TaxID=121162 RepID=UPI00406D9BCC